LIGQPVEKAQPKEQFEMIAAAAFISFALLVVAWFIAPSRSEVK
jgi:hypothetical protein